MLDRFYYQIYLGTAEPLVKQFRFSKYLLLTSVKSLFVVLFIPFFINIFTKIYVFRPLVEYFWDTKQTEIFLNYELQEKAFTEIRNFEEKIYFDYLLKTSEGPHFQGGFTWPQNENKPNLSSFVVFEGPTISKSFFFREAGGFIEIVPISIPEGQSPFFFPYRNIPSAKSERFCNDSEETWLGKSRKAGTELGERRDVVPAFLFSPNYAPTFLLSSVSSRPWPFFSEAGNSRLNIFKRAEETKSLLSSVLSLKYNLSRLDLSNRLSAVKLSLTEPYRNRSDFDSSEPQSPLCLTETKKAEPYRNRNDFDSAEIKNVLNSDSTKPRLFFLSNSINSRLESRPVNFQVGPNFSNFERNGEEWLPGRSTDSISPGGAFYFSKNTESIFRQKTRELADHYNKESISALTNLLADFMGLIILLILLINMKMSLMNTTAFLSESFFSLKDSKKAFLMLLFTDLLVGFHSPRGWEVIFHFLFEHFGLPENHNIIFLLVGTFPVLLDALFKYWIFRHLNRHSPATVATFQAMVE
jgi:hypothetical protein